MLCNSLVASLSEQVFGDIETEPDDMVEDRLFTSKVESRVAETGLVAMPSPFSSALRPAMEGIAVVRRLLSGTFIGIE